MRYISILIILLLFGCKNQTTNLTEVTAVTEYKIHHSASEMWNDFIQSHPELKNNGGERIGILPKRS